MRDATIRSGVFTPQEISLMREVVGLIEKEPWFYRSEGNSEELARLVIARFENGLRDRSELLEFCETVAKRRWNKSLS